MTMHEIMIYEMFPTFPVTLAKSDCLFMDFDGHGVQFVLDVLDGIHIRWLWWANYDINVLLLWKNHKYASIVSCVVLLHHKARSILMHVINNVYD